ncbi:MAG: thioester domain-containing protein [Umezawaea sp.]
MASRLSASRIGAAVLGASIALLASAIPASAEVHVKPKGEWDQEGIGVFLEGNGNSLTTSLIGLQIDNTDTKVQSYCVELPTPLKGGHGLKEVAWDKHPNPKTKFKENAAKVSWILQNSFPLVSADDISKVEALKGHKISEKEAIAATQAAIWHFSDDAKLDKAKVVKSDDKETRGDVLAVYEYLTGDANQGNVEQPTPTLALEPADKSGAPGDLIGPFTITTTAGEVVLKADLPQGVTLADKDGNTLSDPQGGTFAVKDAGTKTKEFWVKVPADAADGKASFSVEANATLTQGRLFVSSNDQLQTQSLIVASPSKVSLKAPGTASWKAGEVVPPSSTSESAPPTSTTESAPPSETTPTTTTTEAVPAGGSSGETGGLASTGASIFVPLIIGIVLVGGGAGALLVMRRRKSTPQNPAQ